MPVLWVCSYTQTRIKPLISKGTKNSQRCTTLNATASNPCHVRNWMRLPQTHVTYVTECDCPNPMPRTSTLNATAPTPCHVRNCVVCVPATNRSVWPCLVCLGQLPCAVRRRAWCVCATAAIGWMRLVSGIVYYVWAYIHMYKYKYK